jgi:hypothetical protein
MNEVGPQEIQEAKIASFRQLLCRNPPPLPRFEILSDKGPVTMLCCTLCIAGEDARGARDAGAGKGCHEEEAGHDADAGENSKRDRRHF